MATPPRGRATDATRDWRALSVIVAYGCSFCTEISDMSNSCFGSYGGGCCFCTESSAMSNTSVWFAE